MRALLLAVLAGARPLAAEPARPVKLEKAAADAVVKEILKDRTDTEEWLQGDITSYLATVDREDFGTKKTLTVGRAADNNVRIDDAEVDAASPAGDGRGRQVPRPGGRRRRAIHGRHRGEARGDRRPSSVARRPLSAAALAPALSGDHRLRSEEPALQGLQGAEVLPGRPGVPLRAAAHAEPEAGNDGHPLDARQPAQRAAGRLVRLRGGRRRRSGSRRSACSSPGVGENDIGVFFRDATSGKESYALGRYVDAKKLRERATTCSTSTSPTTRRARSRTTTTARFRPRQTCWRSRSAPARWTRTITRRRRLPAARLPTALCAKLSPERSEQRGSLARSLAALDSR